MTLSDITGRVALVTGGSRGIGRASALALAEAGADVAVNYRERADEARDVRESIEALGRRCVLVQADVGVASEVARLVARVQEDLGSIEILVNNAGVTNRRALEELDEAVWDETMNTNLKSAFLLTQAVLPPMRSSGWGRIINLSSVAAQLGGVIGPHYAASKAGLHGLTHGYAAFLAKEGVTANVIAPALVETEMVTSNPNARPDLLPVGRFGQVDEVAAVVVLLARNGYITGQTINVNGGWYMS